MSVQFRTFRSGDGNSLADAWTQAVPADPITRSRFRTQFLLDRNFDPAGMFVATDGDRVVGSLYAVRRRIAVAAADLEPTTGWIGYFFVAASHRRQGVATALFEAAFAWLADQAVTTVLFSSYTPNYFLPGLDRDRYPAAAELCAKLGFEVQYETVAMDGDLTGYAMPEAVAGKIATLRDRGYVLGTPGPDDLPELVEVADTEFNPDWGRAIREAVLDGLDLERIQIARSPEGPILGWAMHGTYERVLERFGPFGVVPASRGLGLGEVLLHLTLQQMRGAGAHNAWFLWTEATSPAGVLYLKTGFRITRTFSVLRATIGQGTSPRLQEGRP